MAGDDEDFRKIVLKSLMRLLEGRLEQLEDHKKYNGRIDKEILDTRNDIYRYKRLLNELEED